MALNSPVYHIVNFAIALVWLVNGLFCKVLNWVPRHEQIVGEILGVEWAREATFAIGVGETAMAAWILSNYRKELNTWTQITLVGTMNIIEFIRVPGLLLWGRFNLVFALLFMFAIWFNQYQLRKETNPSV